MTDTLKKLAKATAPAGEAGDSNSVRAERAGEAGDSNSVRAERAGEAGDIDMRASAPGPRVRIVSRRDGFRRCGVAHPATPTFHAADRFTGDELDRLRRDPMLIVDLMDGDGRLAGT